ncbi:MAG: zinc ribbon domain-containing protein [Candidatus Thiodiazotropha sp.]
MPIYEYRCEACEHELEAIQKMSDPALSECPECKRDSLKKVISAAAFRLKGSGWYETDFKSGSKKNIHDSGSEAKASKTESKPASCSGGGCGCH